MDEMMFVGEKSIHNGTSSKFITIPIAVIKDVGQVDKVKIYYDSNKKEMIVKFF